MSNNHHRRVWFLIAAIAIGIALVLTLVPNGHSGHSSDWLAILPILFVGMISPLSLLSPMDFMYLSRTPHAPAHRALFQRPPPFKLA
jgi:uncharacterized membrane protein